MKNIGHSIKNHRTFLLGLWCFLFGLVPVSGQVSPLDRKVNLKDDSCTVRQVLDTLSKQAQCYFTFSSHLIDVQRRVNVELQNESLNYALNLVLNDTTLVYSVVKKQVIISAKPEATFQTEQYSDSIIRIHAQVVDGKTQKPLQYAHVGLLGRYFTGTTTNADGFLNMVIGSAQKSDTLMVSFLGYESYVTPVRELLQGDSVLRLTPSHVSLQEIIVRSRDPNYLIEQAIDVVEQNYCTNRISYRTFYREWVMKNRRYNMYLESLLDVSFGRMIPGAESEESARLVKSRKVYDVNQIDTVSFKLQGGVDACLQMDVVRHPPDFLQKEGMSWFDYSFEDIQLMEDKEVFVIGFRPKSSVFEPMYSGRIFLEAKSLAIVKVEFGYPQKVAEQMASRMVTKRSRGVKVKPMVLSYSVDYRNINGTYFLNQSKGELQYRIKHKKSWFPSLFEIHFEMATTSVDTLSVTRIGYRNRLSSSTIMSEIPLDYDRNFWGDVNFIEPEQDIQEAIKRLESLQLEVVQ